MPEQAGVPLARHLLWTCHIWHRRLEWCWFYLFLIVVKSSTLWSDPFEDCFMWLMCVLKAKRLFSLLLLLQAAQFSLPLSACQSFFFGGGQLSKSLDFSLFCDETAVGRAWHQGASPWIEARCLRDFESWPFPEKANPLKICASLSRVQWTSAPYSTGSFG